MRVNWWNGPAAKVSSSAMIDFACRRVKWTECNTDTEVGCNARRPSPRRRDFRFGIKSRQDVTSERKLGVLVMARLLRFFPVLVCFGITAVVATVFLHSVDLKPEVGENFFFSKNDPQVRSENEISRIFPRK